MSSSIIETKYLTKTYVQGEAEYTALENVNLQIKKGEMVSIMGPSGCGKTTLLNLLSGLDKPTGGEIIFDGMPMTAMGDSELTWFRLTKIGIVFQFFNLVPTLTAVENIELPMAFAGVPSDERKERALSLLEEVNLLEKQDRMPYGLSGGEQQRIAIARALANKPLVVLADEPTGNLDSKTSGQIMDLMRKFNEEEEQTFIIVTHDPSISQRTDRTIHMKDGIIVGEEPSTSSTISQKRLFKKFSSSLPADFTTWLTYRQLAIEIRLGELEKKVLEKHF